ncbi:MAG: HAMP domain-containing histidine kinase [Proteobacteria bacterium]|nr:HAMP domain-containing histidine kinase [Pseudomonadota bacterium]
MSRLTLIAVNPAADPAVSARFAHDIRNAAATVALHMETLERLAGPRGAKAASAAQAIIGKIASICADALHAQAHPQAPTRRAGFDIARCVDEVASLLSPLLPQGCAMRVHAERSAMAFGNSAETFRIIFNLVHNAVMVARRGARLGRIDIGIERGAAHVAVRIVDDGPGLPKDVRRNLFRARAAGAGGHGYGLAIARELAERSGGTLVYAAFAGETAFTLTLPALAMQSVRESPVTRSLGRRAAPA